MNKPFKKDWINYLLFFAVFVATYILMSAIFGTINSWKSTIIGALVGGIVFTGVLLFFKNKKNKKNG